MYPRFTFFWWSPYAVFGLYYCINFLEAGRILNIYVTGLAGFDLLIFIMHQVSQFSLSITLIEDCTGCPGVSEEESTRLQHFASLLSMATAALRADTLQTLHCHKATAKLGFIATSIFAGLLQEGFCTAEESQEAAGDKDGAGKFQESEGTVSPSFKSMHGLFPMPFRFAPSKAVCCKFPAIRPRYTSSQDAHLLSSLWQESPEKSVHSL